MKRAIIMTGFTAIALAGTAITASAFGKGHDEGPRMPHISFSELDANGDGQVTKEEIQAHFKARFDAADSDGDGNLSAEEMAARAEKERAERMQRRVSRMIERRDTDGDGLLSAEEMQAGRPGVDMLTRLDTDKDGAVSEQEFAKLERRGQHGGPGERRGEHWGEHHQRGGDCDGHGGKRHGQGDGQGYRQPVE